MSTPHHLSVHSYYSRADTVYQRIPTASFWHLVPFRLLQTGMQWKFKKASIYCFFGHCSLSMHCVSYQRSEQQYRTGNYPQVLPQLSFGPCQSLGQWSSDGSLFHSVTEWLAELAHNRTKTRPALNEDDTGGCQKMKLHSRAVLTVEVADADKIPSFFQPRNECLQLRRGTFTDTFLTLLVLSEEKQWCK